MRNEQEVERPLHDARLVELTGWGRRPRSAGWVVSPADDGHLAELVSAFRHPRGMLARGLGRSYGDAALNGGGVLLRRAGAAGIRNFDETAGTVTVGAATSIDTLIRAVLPHGWFPSVVPGTAQVTVGGALAADIHGKNHHRSGSFADHVTSFRLMQTDGQEASVAAQGDHELFRATAGGMGLTGVITEATLTLLKVATGWMLVDTIRGKDLDDVMGAMERTDRRSRYSVAWLDLVAQGGSLGRGVVTNAEHAAVEQVAGKERFPAMSGSLATVPPGLPSGMLARPLARMLNTAWFTRSRPGRSLQTITGFFFPLDMLENWNLLYGPQGFLQYQFAVPLAESETLREIVELLSRRRTPVMLAVLKRFGAGHGYLSFPIEGWTLAVDVPAGIDGLPGLLDDLDELVASAGGRVYLAKDARVRAEVVRAMYPELDDWRLVRHRCDPSGRMQSDLARRLRLFDDARDG